MKFNGRNIYTGKGVTIGKNVRLGDNVTIYDNVTIEDDTTISNDCVIGEPPAAYYNNPDFQNPALTIGPNSLIRSHCIIYAGSKIGSNFQTGHRVTIREGMSIGTNCSVGTLCDLQGHAVLGDFCRLHSNVHIGQHSRLGSFVFIYPYVVLTNDPHPPSNELKGVDIGDYAQIAVMSVILPGVKIGHHALVGAGTIVSKHVANFALVVGNPQQVIKDVRNIKNKDGVANYPWPNRFERGMPWAQLGFEDWCEQTNRDEFGIRLGN